jgi:hypothetical protein
MAQAVDPRGPASRLHRRDGAGQRGRDQLGPVGTTGRILKVVPGG